MRRPIIRARPSLCEVASGDTSFGHHWYGRSGRWASTDASPYEPTWVWVHQHQPRGCMMTLPTSSPTHLPGLRDVTPLSQPLPPLQDLNYVAEGFIPFGSPDTTFID